MTGLRGHYKIYDGTNKNRPKQCIIIGKNPRQIFNAPINLYLTISELTNFGFNNYYIYIFRPSRNPITCTRLSVRFPSYRQTCAAIVIIIVFGRCVFIEKFGPQWNYLSGRDIALWSYAIIIIIFGSRIALCVVQKVRDQGRQEINRVVIIGRI